MKKFILLTMTIVLTAAMITACGCTSQDAQYTTAPTTRPTASTTAPTTEATTRATTEATTLPTMDNGNGPLDSTTRNTTESTVDTTEQMPESRSRQMQPSVNTR